MTTISSYTTLQTAVAEYLARDDLTARIPTFIQFFEAKMNRELFVNAMETRSTTTVDTSTSEPEFISMPNTFQSMRRIRLSSVTGKPCLEFRSGTQMDEFRFGVSNAAGQPKYFTIMGGEIELAPTPDQNYTIEMVYRSVIPALASNSTNWLLSLAPDLYLYGALLESSPYIKEDARLQTWGALFTSARDSLNQLGQMQAFNAGPTQVRISGITP